MKGEKFYKWIIGVLVVINLGTLAFIWFGRPPHPPPPHPGEEPRLATEIGLTGDSKIKVDAMEKQHHLDKHILMEKDSELHKKMFSKIGTGEDVSAIQNELNKNKEEIEKMTFKFFNDVAEFCNETQLKELVDHVKHRLSEMRPMPPPPPGSSATWWRRCRRAGRRGWWRRRRRCPCCRR